MTSQPDASYPSDPPSDIHSLIGAHAVDALESIERAEFEQHLAACAYCREELARLTDTAATLSALAVAEPPAELRGATLARIRQTRQDHAPADMSAQPDAPVAPRVGAADDLAVARARRSARVTRWVAVAAAVVAVVAAGGYGYSQHQLRQVNRQIQTATSLLDAPDLRTAQAAVRGGGKVRILASAEKGTMLLSATGLRVLGPQHTYQVWAIRPSGSPISLGTFDASGGSARATMTGNLAGPVTVGITVEPAGGSTQPTTKPVFASKLTS